MKPRDLDSALDGFEEPLVIEANRQLTAQAAARRTLDEHLGGVISKGYHLQRIFDQTTHWQPADAPEPLLLVELQPSHRRNILRWVHRNASVLAHTASWSWMSYRQPGGETACEAFDAAVQEDLDQVYDDPIGWIDSQPLVKELQRLIALDEEHTWLGDSAVEILMADF